VAVFVATIPNQFTICDKQRQDLLNLLKFLVANISKHYISNPNLLFPEKEAKKRCSASQN
jgi:hypothetical protein